MDQFEIKDGAAIIPEGTTKITDYAFCECTSLESITIPDCVTSIGEGAFYNCTSLKSITIGNSVTSIGVYAFAVCDSLESIVVAEGNPVYDSREGCNAIIETETNTLICGCKSTIIPDSVTSIGKEAFDGCTSLTSITIPDSVTSIGEDAFRGCTSLTTVTFAEVRNPFEGCTSLSTIYVPAKKADDYKKRLPEELHDIIVELDPEKKTKAKK